MKLLALLLAISCAGCVQMLDTNGLTKDQRREYNDIQLYRLRQKAAREGEVLASLAHGIGQVERRL